MNCIGDEHALLLGLEGFGYVARAIWRRRGEKVAGFYEEWGGGVFSWWMGGGGREE